MTSADAEGAQFVRDAAGLRSTIAVGTEIVATALEGIALAGPQVALGEAGPLDWLASWRANLLAVDLPCGAPRERVHCAVQAGNARLVLRQAIHGGLQRLSCQLLSVMSLAALRGRLTSQRVADSPQPNRGSRS